MYQSTEKYFFLHLTADARIWSLTPDGTTWPYAPCATRLAGAGLAGVNGGRPPVRQAAFELAQRERITNDRREMGGCLLFHFMTVACVFLTLDFAWVSSKRPS
jgi:hypothetical protein